MSTQTPNNNTRIAKNTLLLYFRMLFTMAVSLYTSRVVLNTLGVEDFGVYNVVGGIVSMLSFFNSFSVIKESLLFTYLQRKQKAALKSTPLHDPMVLL